MMGYLLRVAEANGLPTPTSMSVDAWQFLLVSVASRSDGRFRGPIGGMGALNGADRCGLGSRYWNTRRPRYCPACLGDRPIWKAQWMLSFCVACDIHGTALIDSCRACSRPLSWNRSSLTSCRCGADLRSALAEKASENIMGAACRFARAWEHQVEQEDGELPGGRLTGFLDRIWLFGGYALNAGSRPQKVSNLHQVAQASQMVEAAGGVEAGWPDGLYRLLSHVENTFGNHESSRLSARFGGFYKQLFHPSRSEAFADIRAAFNAYVNDRWCGQLTIRNTRLNAATLSDHAWISATVAARRLGWKTSRVRTWISRGLVNGKVVELASGRTSSVIHRDDVDRLVAESASWLTLKDACLLLHRGKAAIRTLVASGLLKPAAGPQIDGNPVWRFKRCELEAIAACMSRSK
jgi:hypothetical protein